MSKQNAANLLRPLLLSPLFACLQLLLFEIINNLISACSKVLLKCTRVHRTVYKIKIKAQPKRTRSAHLQNKIFDIRAYT